MEVEGPPGEFFQDYGTLVEADVVYNLNRDKKEASDHEEDATPMSIKLKEVANLYVNGEVKVTNLSILD